MGNVFPSDIQLPSSTGSLSADERAVRAYVDIFAREPGSPLISNLTTKVEVGSAGPWQFPVSVNDNLDLPNCYLCSPRTQYTDYAAYELTQLGYPLAEILLRRVLSLTGSILRRAALDRVVIFNNWLLSTNLYPAKWHGEGLAAIVSSLTTRYPDHAILFRSLNSRQNLALLDTLRGLGARLLASRVVWHYDGAAPRFTQTTAYRRDLRLLEHSDWDIVNHEELRQADMEDFARLYEQLYVEKYTALNPRYTARYLDACYESHLLRFRALRDRTTHRWLGVLGIFERDGVLTAPIVGYDTKIPAKRGLYRALMTLALRETAERGVMLNLSAGAGSFKRLRGGEPCVEYMAVLDGHLPRKRRWPWRMLAEMSNRVAMPLAWRMEVGR